MKKFRTMADIAIGASLALVLLLATPVVAATGTKKTTLTYKNIKVNINGAPVTLTDSNGSIQEPFIESDWVYVPLSATARALGKSASWDNKTNTVNLRDLKPQDGKTAVKLGDLHPVKEGRAAISHKGDVQAANGQYVFDLWAGSYDWGNSQMVYRDYALNGQYTKIEGDFIVVGEYSSKTFQLYGDRRLLYTVTVEDNGPVAHFEVDLVGINTLKIALPESHSGKTGVANVKLYK